MGNNITGKDEEASSFIICQTNQGFDVRATLLRLSRHLVVFEVYNPHLILRTSEVLTSFQIIIDDHPVYSGRAVISSLVNVGTVLVCEATLDEAWQDVEMFTLATNRDSLRDSYHGFMQQCQKGYKILPEFKSLIADMQMFLMDLRLWLDQVELGIRALPSGDRLQVEREIVRDLVQPIVPYLNALFEKFELMAENIDDDLQPVHHAYVKRQLHPLVLCAPFAYRTFTKPLGYAGDYEVVNMIIRDPYEGSSVFAKVLNAWFLLQPPAEAHRNRIQYLTQKMIEETVRVNAQNRMARVFNLGCGPAAEVQNFLSGSHVCERAELTLLDFNEETVAYTGELLKELKRRYGRNTSIQMIKKSIAQIIRGASKMADSLQKYDYVYCAGLFDYFPDHVCRELMNIFYTMLAPGGLLVTTNVDPSNPIRYMLDYVLEWHLICRTGPQLLGLGPTEACRDLMTVYADQTGVNIYLEVRKPTA